MAGLLAKLAQGLGAFSESYGGSMLEQKRQDRLERIRKEERTADKAFSKSEREAREKVSADAADLKFSRDLSLNQSTVNQQTEAAAKLATAKVDATALKVTTDATAAEKLAESKFKVAEVNARGRGSGRSSKTKDGKTSVWKEPDEYGELRPVGEEWYVGDNLYRKRHGSKTIIKRDPEGKETELNPNTAFELLPEGFQDQKGYDKLTKQYRAEKKTDKAKFDAALKEGGAEFLRKVHNRMSKAKGKTETKPEVTSETNKTTSEKGLIKQVETESLDQLKGDEWWLAPELPAAKMRKLSKARLAMRDKYFANKRYQAMSSGMGSLPKEFKAGA